MSDLPSFLVQTAPGRYTLTFSASGADTYRLCNMKFSWAYITRIEAAVARAGQNYGTAIHLALAHAYRNMGGAPEAVEAECLEVIRAHFAEHPQPELGRKGRPEWRHAERAASALLAYRQHYGAEDFEVLGVEEPFEVELGTFEVEIPGEEQADSMGWSTGVIVTVVLRGIRDLRIRWHSQLWVLDHKTSTEWSELALDEGKASFQFQAYAWVERAASGPLPVGGVIANYIVSREPYSEGYKPRANALPRDQFERHAFVFSDAQLDEWHDRAMGTARDIWRRWQEGEWPQNSTACAHWGKCEYFKLCWETDPAYRLSAAMGGDYRERTPSPFEELAARGERS